MLQHGRKSQNPLTLAAEQADAPKPIRPDYFNAAELAEWRMLIDRLGDAWLPPEVHVLTETLVSATCGLDAVNREISKFDAKLPKDVYERRLLTDLIKLQTALAGQVMSLSTKLRITPSSRDDRGRSATDYRRRMEQRGPKPWDVDEDEGLEDAMN